jgi:hypothetical protein
MDERVGVLSLRADKSEADSKSLRDEFDDLHAEFAAFKLETAVWRASVDIWVSVVRGFCALLGIAAAAALIKLVVK